MRDRDIEDTMEEPNGCKRGAETPLGLWSRL